MSPKDVVWGGLSALRVVVTHGPGEKSVLSRCFLREAFFCFVLT